MTNDNDAETPIYRLLYFSRAHFDTIARMDQAIPEILGVARPENSRRGITGCLLACNGWFIQTLEGERDAVRSLFEKIRGDARHEDVTLVKTGKAEARAFPLWSMCGQELSPADDTVVALLEKGAAFDARKLQPQQAVALLQRIQFFQEWQRDHPSGGLTHAAVNTTALHHSS